LCLYKETSAYSIQQLQKFSDNELTESEQIFETLFTTIDGYSVFKFFLDDDFVLEKLELALKEKINQKRFTEKQKEILKQLLCVRDPLIEPGKGKGEPSKALHKSAMQVSFESEKVKARDELLRIANMADVTPF